MLTLSPAMAAAIETTPEAPLNEFSAAAEMDRAAYATLSTRTK